ncbi:MAG: hypothetical protein U0169_04825 [Polyangiaceae bacterium]
MRTAWILLLGWMVAMVACAPLAPSEDRADSVASGAATLPLTVSDGFDLDRSTPVGERDAFAVSNGNVHLVVWTDVRGGNTRHVYATIAGNDGATFSTNSGTRLSTNSLAREDFAPRAAWNGKEFFVVWNSRTLATGDVDVNGVRVSATGAVVGAVMSVSTVAGSNQTDADIACLPGTTAAPGQCFAVWQDDREGTATRRIYGIFWFADGTLNAAAGTGVRLATIGGTDELLHPRIAARTNHYLLTFAMRPTGSQDTWTGWLAMRGDSTLIGFDYLRTSAGFANLQRSLVPADFGGLHGYVMAYTFAPSTDPRVGTRVNLAFVDEAGDWRLGRIAASTTTPALTEPSVGIDSGGAWVVAWKAFDAYAVGNPGAFDVFMLRGGVDAAGTEFTTPGFVADVIPDVREGFDLTLGAPQVVTGLRPGAFANVVLARAPRPGAPADSRVAFAAMAGDFLDGTRPAHRSITLQPQSAPHAASDGTDFLVAWASTHPSPYTGPSANLATYFSHLFVQPVSATTGPVGAPVEISDGRFDRRAPSVTFDGTNYLVVWQDGEGPWTVKAQRFGVDGRLDERHLRRLATGLPIPGSRRRRRPRDRARSRRLEEQDEPERPARPRHGSRRLVVGRRHGSLLPHERPVPVDDRGRFRRRRRSLPRRVGSSVDRVDAARSEERPRRRRHGHRGGPTRERSVRRDDRGIEPCPRADSERHVRRRRVPRRLGGHRNDLATGSGFSIFASRVTRDGVPLRDATDLTKGEYGNHTGVVVSSMGDRAVASWWRGVFTTTPASAITSFVASGAGRPWRSIRGIPRASAPRSTSTVRGSGTSPSRATRTVVRSSSLRSAENSSAAGPSGSGSWTVSGVRARTPSPIVRPGACAWTVSAATARCGDDACSVCTVAKGPRSTARARPVPSTPCAVSEAGRDRATARERANFPDPTREPTRVAIPGPTRRPTPRTARTRRRTRRTVRFPSRTRPTRPPRPMAPTTPQDRTAGRTVPPSSTPTRTRRAERPATAP